MLCWMYWAMRSPLCRATSASSRCAIGHAATGLAVTASDAMTNEMIVFMAGRRAGVARRRTELNYRSVAFRYDNDYIADPDSVALSVRWPVIGGDEHEIGLWLDGLLPDSPNVRRDWAQRSGATALDAMSMLGTEIGLDCAGATQFWGIIDVSDKVQVSAYIRCHTPSLLWGHDQEEGSGQALAQRSDAGGTDPQVPRRQDRGSVDRVDPLARRPAVSALRPRQHPAPHSAQDDALPVPPQRLPQVLLGEGRHRDAGLEAGLSGVGHRRLPVQHVTKGRQLDEAAPRPGHLAEVGVALGAPHPPVLGRPQQRTLRRPRRSRRDVHRRAGQEHARQGPQAPHPRQRRGGQDRGGRDQGPRHRQGVSPSRRQHGQANTARLREVAHHTVSDGLHRRSQGLQRPATP